MSFKDDWKAAMEKSAVKLIRKEVEKFNKLAIATEDEVGINASQFVLDQWEHMVDGSVLPYVRMGANYRVTAGILIGFVAMKILQFHDHQIDYMEQCEQALDELTPEEMPSA